MVYLHCALNGERPAPGPPMTWTTVLGVRADLHVLHGFTTAWGISSAGQAWTGHQPGWERGEATIDS